MYDRDALVWAEEQSKLLRRLAHGERINGAIDWPHVIEEIEDVGLSQLRGCESLSRQALVHLMKIWAFPDGPVAHWRGATIGFLGDVQSGFSPSMRQRIVLSDLYRKALDQVREGDQIGTAVRTLPDECPFALDDLVAAKVNVGMLAAKLGGQV